LVAASDLQSALRRYWGYETFRPLQERVVNSLLDGHDVAVVMPTGGGKSLCYQLPALVLGRTVIVVSPLIALMQDQVAQLREMGIPAAFVNSSISTSDQRVIIESAIRGDYRLLYFSPERLARADTVAWLKRVPIAFFAIDEAHCISEWGHEFRPEYRQLSSLRTNFPDRPIAAFTASATRRVRQDILAQLQLTDPHKYIVSFHRPNLRYLVKCCQDQNEQDRLLISALRAHAGENVIVYSPTIARVEETVDFLEEHQIAAVPYHGQMDAATRKRNQERWMSDEVPVLVGTIAFGLGINKSAVRSVIHLSLPKSIEQYYQEAGRAGRDGEPAECALLWQPKDVGLLQFFIDQVKDPIEKKRAAQRYYEIKNFAESYQCRDRQICLHFGETPKWETCSMCDVCSDPPEWFLGRRGGARPFRMPKFLGRAVDPDLLAFLRQWRRQTAIQEGTAVTMVLQDASLEDLCRQQPRRRPDLLKITGIGEKKAERYGSAILRALEQYRQGSRAEKREEPAESPTEETIRLLKSGRDFAEIAEIRGRQIGTVIETVAELVEKGRIPFDERWVNEENRKLIEEAAARTGLRRLKPIRAALPETIDYSDIRLVVARMRNQSNAASDS
jgi:ATP-dependent DNA helicase RecQ